MTKILTAGTDDRAHKVALARRAVAQADAERYAWLRAQAVQELGDCAPSTRVADYLPIAAAPAALFCPRTGVVIGRTLAMHMGGLDFSEYDASALDVESVVDALCRADLPPLPVAGDRR